MRDKLFFTILQFPPRLYRIDYQHKGQCASGIPLHALHEVLLYNVSDKKNLASTEDVGYGKGGKRRNKYHNDPAYNTG